MAYSTFTLRGKHTTLTGSPHAGRVTIQPNTTIRDLVGNVIMTGSVTVSLAGDGSWAVTLPCDSPDLNPISGIGYRIDYDLIKSGVQDQVIAAPASLAGTTVDVSDLVSDVSLPTPVTTIVGPAGIRIIQHGTDPNVARPDITVVYWQGTARPVNGLPTDWWYNA